MKLFFYISLFLFLLCQITDAQKFDESILKISAPLNVAIGDKFEVKCILLKPVEAFSLRSGLKHKMEVRTVPKNPYKYAITKDGVFEDVEPKYHNIRNHSVVTVTSKPAKPSFPKLYICEVTYNNDVYQSYQNIFFGSAPSFSKLVVSKKGTNEFEFNCTSNLAESVELYINNMLDTQVPGGNALVARRKFDENLGVTHNITCLARNRYGSRSDGKSIMLENTLIKQSTDKRSDFVSEKIFFFPFIILAAFIIFCFIYNCHKGIKMCNQIAHEKATTPASVTVDKNNDTTSLIDIKDSDDVDHQSSVSFLGKNENENQTTVQAAENVDEIKGCKAEIILKSRGKQKGLYEYQLRDYLNGFRSILDNEQARNLELIITDERSDTTEGSVELSYRFKGRFQHVKAFLDPKFRQVIRDNAEVELVELTISPKEPSKTTGGEVIEMPGAV